MIHWFRLSGWQKMLLLIYRTRDRECYAERLYKKVKGSRSHARDVIRGLGKRGLIDINEDSKTKMITLSMKGRRIAEALLQVKTELNDFATRSWR